MNVNSWRFIYAADMQPGSPKSYRYRPAWRENWLTAKRQIMARRPEFVLIGGDVTRDGSIHRWELEEMKAEFDGMDLPYHVIPGNMDTGNKHAPCQGAKPDRRDLELNITSAQLTQFESVFGPSAWSFVHRNVRVSGFCSMLLGSGLPEEVGLWRWLEAHAQASRAQHHLWMMHYALFIDDLHEPSFDLTEPAQYTAWYFGIDAPQRRRLMEIFRATGTTRVTTGHIHCRKDHAVDGIRLDLAPAVCGGQWSDRWPDGDASPGFFEYEVQDARMTKRFIPLERVSIRQDEYGPGGHPPPEARDYSLAWEPGGRPEHGPEC